MRWLRRIAFGGLVVLCVAVCVGSVVLWERSYRQPDTFRVQLPGLGNWVVKSEVGTLHLEEVSRRQADLAAQQQRLALLRQQIAPIAPMFDGHKRGSPRYHQLSRAIFAEQARRFGPYASYSFPHWLPAQLAAALPPVIWLGWRLLKRASLRRRLTQGLCGRCGYDLTGNTSGVCPECGTTIAR